MIGNSIKSDVLPVLAIGGHAVHVLYHTTWTHAQVEHNLEHENFKHSFYTHKPWPGRKKE